jgi:hypothetical protein
VLPGLSALEQPHYDELIWAWAVRNAAVYSDPVFDPGPGRPAEWETLLTLAALAQGARAADVALLDRLFFTGLVGAVSADPLSRIAGRDPEEIVAATPGIGPERLLDFGLRTGPWGEGYGADPDGLTLQRLRAQPNGVDKGPLAPRLPGMLTTPSGHHRAGAAPHHGGRAAAPASSHPPRRGAGARQPPPPALQQLVDAQRAVAHDRPRARCWCIPRTPAVSGSPTAAARRSARRRVRWRRPSR